MHHRAPLVAVRFYVNAILYLFSRIRYYEGNVIELGKISELTHGHGPLFEQANGPEGHH